MVGSVASVDVLSESVVCSDGAVIGSVSSVDVLSERVVCSDEAAVGSVTSADVLSEGVECSDGAVVGSVTSVDVPSESVVFSDGAVVGSVASDVGPSADVACSDGASVGSVDTVDVPCADEERSDGCKDSLNASAACLFGPQYKIRSFWASSSADSKGAISETSGSGMIQGVHCLSKREGTDASAGGRQNVLVCGVAAVVVEATNLQVDMVYGKGDDAESGGSRGRCQAATRQDETSIDVPSEDVESSNGAVVGSVTSVDVPSADEERSDGRNDSLNASAAYLFGPQYEVRSFGR